MSLIFYKMPSFKQSFPEINLYVQVSFLHFLNLQGLSWITQLSTALFQYFTLFLSSSSTGSILLFISHLSIPLK